MPNPQTDSPIAAIGAALTLTVYVALFLKAESQSVVLGMLAAGALAVFVAARLQLTKRIGAAAAGYEKTVNLVVIACVLALLAAFHDQHFALLMTVTVLLYSVVCWGLTIQFGYAGVVNFAGAAFFGVGCYTAAVLTQHTAVPHLLILAIGGALAALIGSLLLLPVLRTKGHYAALVTIAFGILFKTFLEVNDTLGGPQGLKVKGMSVFGWKFNDNVEIGGLEISFYANYAILALILAIAAFAVTRRLERSWIGINLDAVRLDETAAAAFGISSARWKITAFTLANFFAGVAGTLYAMMLGFIAPNNFTFGDSLIMVSIVILGGLGNPWGVPLAAAIVLVLPEKLQILQEYRFLLFAALVIVILLFRPQGLLPRPPRVLPLSRENA
jgi:ABC-type branched-subunit amino acid transport system permease subunit